MPQQTIRERRGLPARSTLGARLRELRIAKGLTQTELAEDRFSKEYVSQIERGKTWPSDQTLEWLADRLDVDRTFLESGVSSGQRGRVESAIARAEVALEARQYAAAVAALDGVVASVAPGCLPDLVVRALLAESWARMYLGDVRQAVGLLETARSLTDDTVFTDVDRADVLFRLGCCRYKLSSIPTAIGLFDQALDLAQRSNLPCDRLRAHIFQWRSRCYRRQRDFEAAREDVERALELAQGLNDLEGVAHSYFLASLVAERTGHWALARSYAERAKAQYEEIADRANVGKLLNNLGGLNFLLGKPDTAVSYLMDAIRVALDVGSTADAAQAVSSLAQIRLRTGKIDEAEAGARQALELLGGRVDFLDEIGNAQLVLGRSLLEQDRLEDAAEAFAAAEVAFRELGSPSHTAAAWMAQGDLAARRGDDETAARLYRRSAETLQDFRF